LIDKLKGLTWLPNVGAMLTDNYVQHFNQKLQIVNLLSANLVFTVSLHIFSDSTEQSQVLIIRIVILLDIFFKFRYTCI